MFSVAAYKSFITLRMNLGSFLHTDLFQMINISGLSVVLRQCEHNICFQVFPKLISVCVGICWQSPLGFTFEIQYNTIG